MKNTLLIVLYLASFCLNFCYSQNRKLAKGNKIPDVTFKIRIGDSSFLKKTNEYKGKFLLIDFWGVHCLPCITSMPEMLRLQEKFQDKLQILFVTEDSDEDVTQLLKKLMLKSSTSKFANAGRKLSFINQDTILKELFPHKVQPTHVWIDASQKFRFISYHNTTTEENISAILNGKNVQLNEQEYSELNIANPFTWLTNENRTSLQYYSFITTHIENGGDERVLKTAIDSTTGKVIGFKCLNSPILELYNIAYLNDWKPNLNFIPENRILVESKDMNRFFQPQETDYWSWWTRNTFSYCLRVPINQSGKSYSIMRQDLNRFFNLDSKIENRKIKCIVLKAIPGNKTFCASELKKPVDKYDDNRRQLILQNVDMDLLANYYLKNLLNIQKKQLPFFNETGYLGKIDIKLPWEPSLTDISIVELRAVLQTYGLDLVEEVRDLNMLVIHDL